MCRTWNLDIDRGLNRVIPPPPWAHLPYPVARFFGFRKSKPEPLGNIMVILWAFVGIFCAISIIQVVSLHVPSFQSRSAPLIVGSFGAAAVLEFYSIESPLAQPRNAILGQLLASLVGVSICKLFRLSDDFESIRWVGAALACATATAVMGITKTLHPPAGATALLAVADEEVAKLGWFLIPIMMLGCGLMLAVALLINNLERQFPTYWWTPEDLTQMRSMFRRRPDETKESDEEAVKDIEANEANGSRQKHRGNEVVIRPGEVIVPEHMYLAQEEQLFLETLSNRL